MEKDKIKFIILLVEYYKEKHNLNGKEVFSLFNENKIFEFLYNNYSSLHTAGKEYTEDEIEEIIKEKNI